MTDKTNTGKNKISVKDYIASIDDEQIKKDCIALAKMMKHISKKNPKMWNIGTIGFDSYRYKYDSGREGENHIIGFYPRKGKITVYLMDGTVRYSTLLSKLGKHTTSRVCIYFKRLDDIQLLVLEKIVGQSYKYIKSKDGSMHRALE